MQKLSVQEILGNPRIQEAINQSLLVQKETGFESCFIATWNGRDMIVNKVAQSDSENKIEVDSVSRVEGHGFNMSVEGQIVFNFHSHSATSLPYPSTADIAFCRQVQRANRWQWEVDSDIQCWCNPLFGVATPKQEEITIFQVPERWVLLDEDEINAFIRKAIQDIYECTYGTRAKKDRHWSPSGGWIVDKIMVAMGTFPPFLYPKDKQRVQRYHKFLDFLRVRLSQMSGGSIVEPAKCWQRLWASF